MNLSDAPIDARSVDFARKAGGVAISLGDLIGAAPAGRTRRSPDGTLRDAEIARRLAILSAPIVERNVMLRVSGRLVRLGDLRAGQQIAWEGDEAPEVRLSGVRRRPDAVPVPTRGAGIRIVPVPAWSGRRVAPPVVRLSGGSGCGVRGSTSREVVARTFRRTVRPAVRACFRRARAGRPDFEARVEVAAVFERGEPAAVRVTGGDVALRACVETAVRTARLPALEERIVVRYPFASHTRAEPDPVPIEDDLDARLTDLFGDAAVIRLAP